MGYYLAGGSWVQPDVSVTHPSQAEAKYLEGAPAIAIEVLSPANRAIHVDVKINLYFEHGAREVWWIYPKTRRVVIYTGSPSNIRVELDAVTTPLIRVELEAVTTPLLPAFSLNASEILAD